MHFQNVCNTSGHIFWHHFHMHTPVFLVACFICIWLLAAESRIQELSQELVRSRELAKRCQKAYERVVNERGNANSDSHHTSQNDNKQLQLQVSI